MALRIFQKGFNYSQDGPGNRLVYHLQGCNMHCPWCSNPEGISMQGSLMVDQSLLLENACPHGAIQGKHLDRSICADCREKPCLDRRGGVRVSCIPYDTEELLREVLGSQPLFFDGGGVTFTGGEATCQFTGLTELLERLKEHGVNTALETNGSHPHLSELGPLLDTIMIDLKHWDAQELHRVTGVAGPETIYQNLECLLSHGAALSIRIPLIGGFNASEADLEGFLRLLSRWNLKNSSVELLSYHEYGKDKWTSCGMCYAMSGGHVKKEVVNRFRDCLQQQGIRVIKT